MVKRIDVPSTQGIETSMTEVNFSDAFATTNHQDGLNTISHLIFNKFPAWIKFLFAIRNSIVQFFGLKTTMPEDYNTEFKVGGYVGYFKIYQILNNEIVMGADDKHLNFRVSIFLNESSTNNVLVTTLVKFNNKFGRVYMKIIKPFHVLVMKRMVNNAYRVN